MFTMTYNEAILIQTAQLAYYRQKIGRKGVKAIKRNTKPCTFNPNAPMPVTAINELVPRGGSFESLPTYRPGGNVDPTRHAWHDAIRKGHFGWIG